MLRGMEEEKKKPGGHPDEKLVAVWSGSNPAVVTVIRSLLQDAGISYSIKGADFEDVFGSMVSGPVDFLVRIEDEEDARALLEKIEQEPEEKS